MYSTLIKVIEQHISLDQDKREMIVEYAQARTYEKGGYLLKSPSVSTEIGFVLSGILRYYYIDEEGNEVTAMFIQEGDFFTDLESFKNKTPSSGYIQAVSKAEVLVFNTHAHKELMARIPGWDLALKQIAQERLLSQLAFSRSLINDDAQNSYKRFLATYPAIAAKASNLHLASFLGISKYTFSRIKTKVEKE